jgi:hypothetical protein
MTDTSATRHVLSQTLPADSAPLPDGLVAVLSPSAPVPAANPLRRSTRY